jgi:hypothetical protein
MPRVVQPLNHSESMRLLHSDPRPSTAPPPPSRPACSTSGAAMLQCCSSSALPAVHSIAEGPSDRLPFISRKPCARATRREPIPPKCSADVIHRLPQQGPLHCSNLNQPSAIAQMHYPLPLILRHCARWMLL